MPFEKVIKFVGLETEETSEEKKKREEERKRKEEEKKKKQMDRSMPHGRWQMKNKDWNELERESR